MANWSTDNFFHLALWYYTILLRAAKDLPHKISRSFINTFTTLFINNATWLNRLNYLRPHMV